jgi:hypothetical protein
MLPFTKRPGRDDSGDVVTKDDLDPPTSQAKRSVPPPAQSERPRKLMPSLSDDELTALMPSKSVAHLGNPLPAAGRPATIPPPARAPASVPPAARSSRVPPKFAAQDPDDDGRTMVRGAPKVVRRGGNSQPPPQMGVPTGPTTISPAAVIKATLESARGQRRNDLMAGPPRDLLEDNADVHPADAGPQRTVQLENSGQVQSLGQQLGTHALMPQAHAQHRSVPPPPGSYPGAGAAFPPPPASYPPPPMSYPPPMNPAYAATVQSSSVPGMSMPPSVPPHFMVPNAPYSDARVDPPALSVTSNHRVAGRPAMSWAAALLAFGLFVGVGAVAVMQGNGGEGLVDTSASFVDPSRAPGGRAAAAQPATPTPVPVEAPKPAEPATVAQPAAPTAPPPVADPGAVVPPVAVAAVPAQPAMPGPVAAPPAVAGQPPGVIGASPMVATPAPVSAPPPGPVAVAKPPEPAPAPKPAPAAAAKPQPRWSPPPQPRATESDAPKKTASSSKKSSGKASGDDEEMKKALEQLQKSQLERSLSE